MAPNNLVQFPARAPATAPTTPASTAPAATGQQHAPLPVTPLLSSRDAFVLRETTYGRIIGREPVLDVAARRFGNDISDVVVITSGIHIGLSPAHLSTISALGMLDPAGRANALRNLGIVTASSEDSPVEDLAEVPLPVFFITPRTRDMASLSDYFFFRGGSFLPAIRFRHGMETGNKPQALGSILLKNSTENVPVVMSKLFTSLYSRVIKNKQVKETDLSIVIGMLIKFEVDNQQVAEIFGIPAPEFQERKEFIESAWTFLSALNTVLSNRSEQTLADFKKAYHRTVF